MRKRGEMLILAGCSCAVALLVGVIIMTSIASFANNNSEGPIGPHGASEIPLGELRDVSSIPEELKPVFESAGQKHQVSPAFVAAIFWKEHGESFPIMGPWASSPAGANGPFQFIEKTWEGWSCKNNDDGIFETDPAKICNGYGQDGTGDNKAHVQDLYDAGFAASDLLGSNGAAPFVTNLDTLRDVASRYNSGKPWNQGQGILETADYVPAVIEAYQEFTNQL